MVNNINLFFKKISREQYDDLKGFGFWFLALGIIVQLITYYLTESSILSYMCGCCGVFSVVLCSERKISFYVFGFLQLFTYVILCIQQRLYGEIAENIFYFVTMLYGIYHWSNNYDDASREINTRGLGIWNNLLTLGFAAFGVFYMYQTLSLTDDSQPFMDAITTVPAFMAQILMTLRYRESWFYWLIIDVGSIIMWSFVGDWCMVAQFVFWSINCIYGFYKWGIRKV